MKKVLLALLLVCSTAAAMIERNGDTAPIMVNAPNFLDFPFPLPDSNDGAPD